MIYIDISREKDFALIPEVPPETITVNLWNDITIRDVWTPITADNIIFNGQRHTLRGLTGPLFAKTTAPTLPPHTTAANSDITVKCLKVYVDMSSSASIMGGLIRYGRKFKANDCEVHFELDSDSAAVVGGIAGMVDEESSIEGCSAFGHINTLAITGGIVGEATGSRLCGNINHAEINVIASTAGGIAGQASQSVIITCENAPDGIVTAPTAGAGGNQIGGIIGHLMRDVQILNCTNYAAVTGGGQVGGIAGLAYEAERGYRIMRNTNAGEVKGRTQVGGIIGMTGWGIVQVSNNLNCADVTATDQGAGGIVGEAFNYAYVPPVGANVGVTHIKNNMASGTHISASANAYRILGGIDKPAYKIMMYGNQAYYHTIVTSDVISRKYIIEKYDFYGADDKHGVSTETRPELPVKTYAPFKAAEPWKPWPSTVLMGGKCLPAPKPIPEWFKGIQCGVPITYTPREEAYSWQ